MARAYAKAMRLPLELLEDIEADRFDVRVSEVEKIAAGLGMDDVQLLRMAALQAENPEGEVYLIDLLHPENNTSH